MLDLFIFRQFFNGSRAFLVTIYNKAYDMIEEFNVVRGLKRRVLCMIGFFIAHVTNTKK